MPELLIVASTTVGAGDATDTLAKAPHKTTTPATAATSRPTRPPKHPNISSDAENTKPGLSVHGPLTRLVWANELGVP